MHDRTDRVPSLDGLRGLAFLLVLLYHSFYLSGVAASSLPWGLRQIVLSGTAGVDIFVVLSGFCLFLPVARSPQKFRTRTFFRRRVERIVPAYYASIVFVLAVPFVLKFGYQLGGIQVHPQPLPSIEQILTHVFFVHTLNPTTWDGVNGSYWSLGLEAQFYVVLPAIVLAFRRFGVRALVVATTVGLVTQLVIFAAWGDDSHFVVPHFLWGASVLGRLMEFGAGMLGAWYVTRTPAPPAVVQRLAALAPAAALCFLLSLRYWEPPDFAAVGIWAITIGLTLVHCATGRSALVATLGCTPLAFLGLISYSLYLLHQPTEYYVSQLGDQLHLHTWANWALQLSVGFVVVLALAMLSFRFFEQPFLRTRPGERIRGPRRAPHGREQRRASVRSGAR